MKKLNIIPVLMVALLIAGSCSHTPIIRSYYILEYSPVALGLSLPENPLPYTVQVSDARIARIYDRSQIVGRYSANKIEYLDNDLWAVRLSSAVPDLIINHFNAYSLFVLTDRDFITQRPDYEVILNISRIERLQSEYYRAAHLNMELLLRRGDDLSNLVRHSFEREDEIFSDDVEIFVQKLSYIIKEETDRFVIKILDFFEQKRLENL